MCKIEYVVKLCVGVEQGIDIQQFLREFSIEQNYSVTELAKVNSVGSQMLKIKMTYVCHSTSFE